MSYDRNQVSIMMLMLSMQVGIKGPQRQKDPQMIWNGTKRYPTEIKRSSI